MVASVYAWKPRTPPPHHPLRQMRFTLLLPNLLLLPICSLWHYYEIPPLFYCFHLSYTDDYCTRPWDSIVLYLTFPSIVWSSLYLSLIMVLCLNVSFCVYWKSKRAVKLRNRLIYFQCSAFSLSFKPFELPTLQNLTDYRFSSALEWFHCCLLEYLGVPLFNLVQSSNLLHLHPLCSAFFPPQS